MEAIEEGFVQRRVVLKGPHLHVDLERCNWISFYLVLCQEGMPGGR